MGAGIGASSAEACDVSEGCVVHRSCRNSLRLKSCGSQNVPYQSGVDDARIDAAVPLAPWNSVVSMAIGFEELLLHGETRPFDVSSSQSNQRVFLRGWRPFWACSQLQKVCGGKGNRSLWPETSNLPEVLACDARTRINRAQDQCNTSEATDGCWQRSVLGQADSCNRNRAAPDGCGPDWIANCDCDEAG